MAPGAVAQIVAESSDSYTVDVLLSDVQLLLQALEPLDLRQSEVRDTCNVQM